MIRADIPVKANGKSHRMVMEGATAALFDKTGLVQRLIVVDDKGGKGLPVVTDEGGNMVKLQRTSRPCSCKGAPWKTPLATLRSQL